MKAFIQSITGGYSSSAKVVDGMLILSLPNARSPIVWQFDLKDISAAALEIVDKKDDGYMLVLKTAKKDVQEIAPFSSKAQALKALMAASKAMNNAQGQINPAQNNQPQGIAIPVATSGLKKLFTIIILLGIFVALIAYMKQQPRGSSSGNSGYTPGNTAAPRGNIDNNQVGVPLSADDFLRNR